jgi:hypothetical protein
MYPYIGGIPFCIGGYICGIPMFCGGGCEYILLPPVPGLRPVMLDGLLELPSDNAFFGDAPPLGVTERNKLSVFKPPRIGQA